MKKYFLVLLIGFLILIPGVNAEEYDTCFDDYLVGTFTSSYKSTYWNTVSPLVPVKPSTTFYLRFFISEDFSTQNNTRFGSSTYGYDSDQNSLGLSSISNYSWDSTYHIWTFTTKDTSNLSFLQFSVYTYNTNYTILENSKFIISDNKDDVISCSISEPEEPDPVVPDSTLDNFYSIYLDKLGMLSNYVVENKFLFSAIGIIILFIVLEFFLILFKGRSRY